MATVVATHASLRYPLFLNNIYKCCIIKRIYKDKFCVLQRNVMHVIYSMFREINNEINCFDKFLFVLVMQVLRVKRWLSTKVYWCFSLLFPGLWNLSNRAHFKGFASFYENIGESFSFDFYARQSRRNIAGKRCCNFNFRFKDKIHCKVNDTERNT